ncbi:uncharacterized protein PST29_2585 [Pseudomonas sp. St29]|nr:uncharacterized protein PST29_2585 [Pseudomonas sp. St29]
MAAGATAAVAGAAVVAAGAATDHPWASATDSQVAEAMSWRCDLPGAGADQEACLSVERNRHRHTGWARCPAPTSERAGVKKTGR